MGITSTGVSRTDSTCQEGSGPLLLVNRLFFVSFWRRKGTISWLRELVYHWMGAPAVEQISPREPKWYPCVLPQSYWPACLGCGFVIDEYMERVSDTTEVTALGEAVCPCGDQGFLEHYQQISPCCEAFHTCHFTLVTPHLSLCRSWCHSFSCPGKKFGGFPLADAFHADSLGSSDPSVYLCVAHHPLPRVWLSSQKLDFCVLSWALGYISSELLESVFFTVEQGLQGQGITGNQRTLNWTHKERCWYSWVQRSSTTGQRAVGHRRAFKTGILRCHKKNWTTETNLPQEHVPILQLFLGSGLVHHCERTIFFSPSQVQVHSEPSAYELGESYSLIAMPAFSPARYLNAAMELWTQLQIPCCPACRVSLFRGRCLPDSNQQRGDRRGPEQPPSRGSQMAKTAIHTVA